MTAQTCTYHCRGYPFGGCDSHFHSAAAFDLHRGGDHDTGRFCLDPHNVDQLEPWTTSGVCKLQRPPIDGPVTIWHLRKTQTQRQSLERAFAGRP